MYKALLFFLVFTVHLNPNIFGQDESLQERQVLISLVDNKDYQIALELIEDYKYEEGLEVILRVKEAVSKLNNPKGYTEVLVLEAKCYTHQYKMEEALKTYREITQLGIDLKNEKIESRGLNAESVILSFLGKFNEVKKCSYRVLSMNHDSINFNYISDAHTVLGDVYSYEYDPDSTLFHFGRAIYIDTLHKDTNSMSFNYMAYGNVLANLGDNEKALEKYLEGVETLRPDIDDFKMAEFNRKLTSVFITEMNFVKAKEYALKAIEVSQEKNLTFNLAYSKNLYGLVLMDEKNYVEAEKYLLEAKAVLDESKKKFAKINNNGALAFLYLETDKLDRAEELLIASNELIEEDDRNTDLTRHNLSWVKLYLKKNQLSNARFKLEDIKTNKDLSKAPYMLIQVSNLEYDLAKKSGQFEMALQKLEETNKMRKEIEQNTQSYIVHDLEAKYDKANKEKEIANLAAQTEIDAIKISQRNNLLIIGLISLLIVLGILALIFKQNKTIKRMMAELQEKNTLITKTLGEKELLLKEIHHRVKNNLQVVSSILSLQSREIEDESALEAISESRNRVKSMAIIHQNLYQDDNLMGINTKDYIEKLSRSLFNSYRIDKDRLELVNEVQELNLDVDTTIPLGLILNELLTNALKYAFPNDKIGEIKVELKEENNQLLLRVSDNGIGIEESKESPDSFGLKMIRTFAKKLDAEWEVKNENGTSISMRIKKYKIAS